MAVAQAPGGTAGSIVDGSPSGSGLLPLTTARICGHSPGAGADNREKATPGSETTDPGRGAADLAIDHRKPTDAAASGRDLDDVGADGQGKRGKKGVEEGDRRSASRLTSAWLLVAGAASGMGTSRILARRCGRARRTAGRPARTPGAEPSPAPEGGVAAPHAARRTPHAAAADPEAEAEAAGFTAAADSRLRPPPHPRPSGGVRDSGGSLRTQQAR